MRFLPVVLAVALAVYALIDCLRTPRDQVRNLPKPVWLLTIVVVVLVGPILWLVAGRTRGPQGPATRQRPVAPDDDPEFLRQLNLQRHLKEREEELRRREEELKRREQDGDTA